MRMFIEQFDVTESELKNLRIRGTKSEDIKQALKDIYLDYKNKVVKATIDQK